MKIRWTGTEYLAEHSPGERAALLAYYSDPEVQWFKAGTQAINGPLPADGYYVLAHCGSIGCCRPAGPFKTPSEARDWSRENWLPKDQEP